MGLHPDFHSVTLADTTRGLAEPLAKWTYGKGVSVSIPLSAKDLILREDITANIVELVMARGGNHLDVQEREERVRSE